MDQTERQRLLWTSLCLLLLAALYTAYIANDARRIGQGMGDFRHFYYAGQAMNQGQDPYESWHQGYLYPPLVAFLWMPVARLSVAAAGWVMLLANVAMFWATTALGLRALGRRLRVPWRPILMAAAALIGTLIVTDKIKGELQHWQTNALMLLMITLGLFWLDALPVAAGLALGIAFNIKFVPLAFLPYLLLRRRWAAALSYAAGIVFFSFLPALVVGWRTNLEYLSKAYVGILGLLGIHIGAAGAKPNEMEVEYSISVTSAMARLVKAQQWGGESLALALSMLVLGLCVSLAAFMYRRAGIPLLRWPAARAQSAHPWRGLIAIEWAGIIVLFLAFSPQSNPRHMSMLLLPCLTGALMLVDGARPCGVKAPTVKSAGRYLLLGLILLALALDLPPGGRRWDWAVYKWRSVSGVSWCALIMYAALLCAGLKRAAALKRVELAAVDSDPSTGTSSGSTPASQK